MFLSSAAWFNDAANKDLQWAWMGIQESYQLKRITSQDQITFMDSSEHFDGGIGSVDEREKFYGIRLQSWRARFYHVEVDVYGHMHFEGRYAMLVSTNMANIGT